MARSGPTVALVNPPVHDFAAYDLWAKPFGLLVIAEHLRLSGVNVRLIDSADPFHPLLEGLPVPKRRRFGSGKFFERDVKKPAVFGDVRRKYHAYGLPPDRLEAAMRNAGPVDAVLTTCAMTYWYPGVFEAIAIAKSVWPHARVLLGGIYATLCREHAEKHSGADAVLAGPWENSAVKFSEITGITLQGIEGPLYRPALDLYPRLEYAPVMLSRGCPLRCAYCASGKLFDKYARRDPAEAVEEVLESARRGITDFAFYDDALLWDGESGIVPFLESIVEKGMNLRFHAPNGLHIARLNKTMASLMKRAGFQTIRLGVESLSGEKHEKWGGKAHPEDIGDVAQALFDAGYARNEVGAYMLAGLPDQSARELEEDIKKLVSIGIRPYIAEYSPLPGTPMFERAAEVSRYDIANEPLTQNNTVLPCAGEEFSPGDLQRLKEMTWPQRRNSIP